MKQHAVRATKRRSRSTWRTQDNAAEQLLIRPAQVAQLLNISRSKAYDLIAAGIIPSIRFGHSIRIPLDRLRAWLEKQ
jgi:excisionase family DNA binding protein